MVAAHTICWTPAPAPAPAPAHTPTSARAPAGPADAPGVGSQLKPPASTSSRHASPLYSPPKAASPRRGPEAPDTTDRAAASTSRPTQHPPTIDDHHSPALPHSPPHARGPCEFPHPPRRHTLRTLGKSAKLEIFYPSSGRRTIKTDLGRAISPQKVNRATASRSGAFAASHSLRLPATGSDHVNLNSGIRSAAPASSRKHPQPSMHLHPLRHWRRIHEPLHISLTAHHRPSPLPAPGHRIPPPMIETRLGTPAHSAHWSPQTQFLHAAATPLL